MTLPHRQLPFVRANSAEGHLVGFPPGLRPRLDDAGACDTVEIGRRCVVERLTRDGVALAYTEAGSGAPALLLVHGWCRDHTHLAPQFEYFGRNHRVVAADLRGHGVSDKPEQEYWLPARPWAPGTSSPC
jgi:hypothetical protein